MAYGIGELMSESRLALRGLLFPGLLHCNSARTRMVDAEAQSSWLPPLILTASFHPCDHLEPPPSVSPQGGKV